jgi:DNA-binding transcriptional MerR regulator
MTLATEEARIVHLFERVEKIEGIAEAPNLDERQRTDLREVARQAVSESEPVRVAVAARILSLSERSVRAWVREGVLKRAAADSSRLLLDPAHLHEVLHLVKDLRERGRDRNLLEAVWYRLSDQALLERQDLNESLDQMRRGEGRVVRPRRRAKTPQVPPV